MNHSLRILGVDDSLVIRVVMKRCFERLGYASYSVVGDGESALALLHEQSFDLVLTDCCMPGMSGMDLLRAIRADAALGCLPVVMMSGLSGHAIENEAKRAGVDGFIAKPFTDAMLQETISGIFDCATCVAA